MYFIITFLIISSLLFVARGSSFSLFTKERTGLLKALLPYIIFIHHSHLYDREFSLAGVVYVVALFFFISGYGLETKRKRNLLLKKDFLIKALQKLLIPLIVPIIIYICLRLYNDSFRAIYEGDIKEFQLILPFTWYVVTLIILYVFFYVSVAMSKGKAILYFSLIVIEILLFNLIGRFIGIPALAHILTTGFIAGILYKNIEKNIVIKCNKNAIIHAFMLSVVMVLITMWIKENPLNNKDIPFIAFVWPTLFIMLYAVVPVCKQDSVIGKVINSISSRSYELYICQSIPFLILGAKNQYPPVVYLLCLFFLCTVVAFGCKYLTGKIFSVSGR